MADTQAGMPPSSQLSTSDLSEPPNIKDDEEYGEIQVKLTTPPAPIQQSQESVTEDSIAVLPESNSPSSSSRPKRTTRNVPPARYLESDDEIVAEAEEPREPSNQRVPSKRSNTNGSTDAGVRKPPAKRARPTPRAKKSKWDSKYVTENEKSPLVNVDLRSLLLQPAAWDCLTTEDKKEILALMPDTSHILGPGTAEARPNFQSLRNDDNFRHDCDQYVTNLSNGMHDPTWLKDAWNAHERRNAGQFDEFHIRKLELDWGATIPDQYKPKHLQPNQNTEPSTSTSQSTSNQADKSQKSEQSTTQKSAASTNGNGKHGKHGKGKGRAAARRSKKGARVADGKGMDGAGDSIEVKGADIGNAGKAPAVDKDAEKAPAPAAVVVNEGDNINTQVVGDHIGDHKAEEAAASSNHNSAVDGGPGPENVGEASVAKDTMDIDNTEG